MKKWLDKRIWLLVGDALILPLVFGCRWLSTTMLSYESVCGMMIFGGKCITCGGTHFVQSLCSGRIGEAWQHNEFLFAATLYLTISWLLLHGAWLCRWAWAKAVLRRMYCIPTLIVWGVILVLFALWRMLPAVITLMRVMPLVVERLLQNT